MEGMEGMEGIDMDMELGAMLPEEDADAMVTADLEGEEGQPLYRGLGGLTGADFQREAERAALSEAEAEADAATAAEVEAARRGVTAMCVEPRACASAAAPPLL